MRAPARCAARTWMPSSSLCAARSLELCSPDLVIPGVSILCGVCLICVLRGFFWDHVLSAMLLGNGAWVCCSTNVVQSRFAVEACDSSEIFMKCVALYNQPLLSYYESLSCWIEATSPPADFDAPQNVYSDILFALRSSATVMQPLRGRRCAWQQHAQAASLLSAKASSGGQLEARRGAMHQSTDSR